MQKAITIEAEGRPSPHLYTVMLRCFDTRETFLDQLTTTENNPQGILVAWAHKAVTDGLIKGSEDAGVFLKDLQDRDEQLIPLDGVFKVWRIRFLLYEGWYILSTLKPYDENLKLREKIYCILDFIKTDMEVAEARSLAKQLPSPAPSSSLRLAQEKYGFYQEHYSTLKAFAQRTHKINKQRRKVEKQLQYWQAKIAFLAQSYNRDAGSKQGNLYTIIVEYFYEIGTYVYQLPTTVGQDLRFILHKWAAWMLRDKTPNGNKIFNDQERLLLLQKLSQEDYQVVPVEGLKNVWATYLSLTTGLACITIIKTAMDKV